MKFKLQSVDVDGVTVTHEFESGEWYTALDGFVKFLRGSGYSLGNNSVGINTAAGHEFFEDTPYWNIAYFDQPEEWT